MAVVAPVKDKILPEVAEEQKSRRSSPYTIVQIHERWHDLNWFILDLFGPKGLILRTWCDHPLPGDAAIRSFDARRLIPGGGERTRVQFEDKVNMSEVGILKL